MYLVCSYLYELGVSCASCRTTATMNSSLSAADKILFTFLQREAKCLIRFAASERHRDFITKQKCDAKCWDVSAAWDSDLSLCMCLSVCLSVCMRTPVCMFVCVCVYVITITMTHVHTYICTLQIGF